MLGGPLQDGVRGLAVTGPVAVGGELDQVVVGQRITHRVRLAVHRQLPPGG